MNNNKTKKEGYIHIYYGDGKGKTSILNGAIIRAISYNKKIEYLSFFKNIKTGEFIFFNKLQKKNNFSFNTFYNFSNKFIWDMDDYEIKKLKKESLKGLEYFKKIINSKNIDLVIADEILDLIINKFISSNEFANILQNRNKSIEIMLSGHVLPKECIDVVDLISKVSKEKHYFDKGIKARKGIEF